MGFDTLHETAIRDITDTIKDGLELSKSLNRPSGVAYSGSLTRATKGLVMEFPVLVSKANHIESAGIVAKAYEAKFVTLLQLAFVASNITNSKEGIEYIRNFHTNLRDGFSVDEFIDFMDGFVQESGLTGDSYARYRAVTEDMKNLCYYFDDDINETALSSFKVMNQYGGIKVIKEADKEPQSFDSKPMSDWNNDDYKTASIVNKDRLKRNTFIQKGKYSIPGDEYEARRQIEKLDKEIEQIEAQIASLNDPNKKLKLEKEIEQLNAQIDRIKKQNNIDDEKLAIDKEKLGLDKARAERDKEKHNLDMLKTSQDMITNYIVPSDLKKANELVPTMMVVNFVYQENENTPAIYRQMVIGVKAKLYEVEPTDVINKIITKNTDNNILLKLVKVSTREISFVKDFLLAIDDAKIDALSRSRRGSTNKLFKVLERRALGGKIRRGMLGKDYFKAISSLVISQEEAEELMKNNVDVNDPRIIRPIMEKLNLISFAIIDESAESVRFIFDSGDDVYETIPLSRLEREQKDGMSKKVINLMAKMNR